MRVKEFLKTKVKSLIYIWALKQLKFLEAIQKPGLFRQFFFANCIKKSQTSRRKKPRRIVNRDVVIEHLNVTNYSVAKFIVPERGI